MRRFPSNTHSYCHRTLKSTGPKWQTVLLRHCLELACTLKSVSLVSQEDLRVTSSRIPNTTGQPEHAPSLPNWKEQNAGYLLSGIWHSRKPPSLRGHRCHKVGLLLSWEREKVGSFSPFQITDQGYPFSYHVSPCPRTVKVRNKDSCTFL